MTFDDLLTARQTEAAQQTSRFSRRRTPALGAVPQVSLLPIEIKTAGRGRTLRLALAGSVAAALLAAGGATFLASAAQTSATTRLADAQSRTLTLNAQIAKFADVQALRQDIAVADAARTVGAAPIVDWTDQVEDIVQDMPYGYRIKSVQADSASATADFPQSDSPLDGPRAATVVVTVDTPSILELPIWLRKLRSIPAYTDANANIGGGAAEPGASTNYTVTITVQLSPEALARIADKEKAR